MKSFDDKYFEIFINDIENQLANGTDRNNLIINSPQKIETVKIGDQIIQI